MTRLRREGLTNAFVVWPLALLLPLPVVLALEALGTFATPLRRAADALPHPVSIVIYFALALAPSYILLARTARTARARAV